MANIQADGNIKTTTFLEILQYRNISFHHLVCRYSYHGGLREGISDLVGRDQAVANALKKIHRTTNVELFLAFVEMEETGQH